MGKREVKVEEEEEQAEERRGDPEGEDKQPLE